ncbi:MAG: T9SS type A sorting domain-containing protein [Melioribacteraceae bacterium]|nr:T9SS type A sorting domain-containing protein [Melioribacteraceae bacterium]
MKKFLLNLLILITLLNSVIHSQTLKDKIAQMVWVGFSGTKLNDTIKIDLSKRNVGGIILFASNISNPTQVKLLNDTIKMIAKTKPFIAVDQEGGKVARLNGSNGFMNTYTAYQLGTIFNSEDSTRKQSRIMAGWLKQTGFNVNLAPVADVNVNSNSPAIGKLERSYSSNPLIVYNHIKIFIEEFDKQNIISCLKHFPGHGSALQDSHLGFTDISNTWQQYELNPYQLLFTKNVNCMVMTGHLYNSQLDDLYPASLSKKVTNDLLRNSIGFYGVTITDAMNMQAITSNYSFEDGITLAVNAGNDIILNTGTLRFGTSLAQQVINVIYNKVMEGKIPLSRIEESYNRIIELKKRNNIITSIENLSEDIQSDFSLFQNYPNPFNSSTIINYTINKPNFVQLKLYDVLGSELITIVNEFKQSGNYKIEFNANNLSSGVYFYKLQVGSNVLVKKMILLR